MEGRTGERRKSCCRCCRAPCSVGMHNDCSCRKAATLHTCHEEKEYVIETKRNKSEPFILRKERDEEIKTLEYTKALWNLIQFYFVNVGATKLCYKHKTIFNKVRSLLNAINNVENTQVKGMCTACNRPNPLEKCKRCEYIANKFLLNKEEERRVQQKYFDSLIVKVNDLLRVILDCDNICQHRHYDDIYSLGELGELLRALIPPDKQRPPHGITLFSKTDSGSFCSVQSLVQSKEFLLNLLSKIKSGSDEISPSADRPYNSAPPTTYCICRNVKDKIDPELILPEIETQKAKLTKAHENVNVVSSTGKYIPQSEKTPKIELPKDKKSRKAKKDEMSPSIENSPKAKKSPNVDKSSKGEKSPRVDKSSKGEKSRKGYKSPKDEKSEKATKGEKASKDAKASKQDKGPKHKMPPESELIIRMIKERERLQKKGEVKSPRAKSEKPREIGNIQTLPQLKGSAFSRQILISSEGSEPVVECISSTLRRRKEMIKGNAVVHFDPLHDKASPPAVSPLLFNVKLAFESADKSKKVSSVSAAVLTTPELPTLPTPTKSLGIASTEQIRNGIIKYRLSDREFIDKGWTVLPTTKMMRKMNIYKMEPPLLGWFERNKNKKIIYYDSGEKLAQIDDEGTGRWYYKNGIVALDYYNAEELNASQRYVVYSSGQNMLNGREAPISVLAAFDFLGNGVVYDSYGKERLKYNQSEGAILDGKIGPPSRWHWHSLNEPPKLQQVFHDTHVEHPDPDIELIIQDERFVKEPNEDMLAIELEKFVKERARKLLKKFKPFEIRMKAVKINDQFSLRVINQSNIYLMFRQGTTLLKLNLGMILKNDEIVDTETCELSHVSTPYDRTPPKTQSLADIQHTIMKARKIGDIRENRQPGIS